MKKLHESQLPDNSPGFTDDSGRWICTGSAMGRRNILPDDPSQPCKLSMIRLNWRDGDYDAGGAYWGRVPGDFIWWASNRADKAGGYHTDGAPGCLIEVFVRAKTRQGAKVLVRDLLPGATFYR